MNRWSGGYGMTVMRYYIGFGLTGVYGRLEYLYALFGKLCPFQSPYQLFGFAGEHGTANDLNSSPAFGFLYMIF